MRYLTGTIECEASGCEEAFEGTWQDDSMEAADMAELPVASQTCPYCGHTQLYPYPGWGYNSEAG